MKTQLVYLIFLFLLQPGIILAQGSFAELQSLQGTWVGEGYQQRGQDDRVDFRQVEEVATLLDGKVIMFHGTGSNPETDFKGFEAVGIMYHDTNDGKTYMHAWTHDGMYTKADVAFNDEGFIWSFKVNNGGTVKYETVISGDTWSETGAYSPDGNSWYPFMEMQLKRK